MAIKSCFLLEDGKYIEVPLSEIAEGGHTKEKYRDRLFCPFGSYLMEVSAPDRKFFYSFSEQEKKLKRAIRNGKIEIFSIDALRSYPSDSTNDQDAIKDAAVDVETESLKQYFLGRLSMALSQLPPEEKQLLDLIYTQGLSERKASRILGIPQSTINKRKLKILAKLLKIILSR